MRVVVLGGAGAMGRVAAHTVAGYPEVSNVIVADRDAHGAHDVAAAIGVKARGVQVDVTDTSALVALLSQADVALNTTGPFFRFGVGIARAAIAARIHVLDIADDPEPTREILALSDDARAAGITYVVGLGASPGVTNLLARVGADHLDDVSSIITGWNVETAAEDVAPVSEHGQPPAAILHWLHQLSGTIPIRRDGRDVDVPPLQPIAIPWPTVPDAVTYTVGHPEPLTIPRRWPMVRESVNVMAIPPALLPVLQQTAAALDRGDVTVDDAARALANLMADQPAPDSPIAAGPALPPLFVSVLGHKQGKPTRVSLWLRDLPGGGMGGSTSIPLSVGLRMLARGSLDRPGVWAPEEAIDPTEFFGLLAEHLPGKGPAVSFSIDREQAILQRQGSGS